MALICDTAVLIAAERHDERVLALAQQAERQGVDLFVPVGCVAQAWRGGVRQASLARFLAGCQEVSLSSDDAREIGRLLARTGTSNVIDASVVIAAAPGHTILTSDPEDLRRLVEAAGTDSQVQPF